MNKANYIAQKIKDLRTSISWSQSELARQSGVTSAAISKIEQGGRIPSMTVTRKIADALKVSVGELTGDESPPSEEVNEEAQAFFRKFGDLKSLEERDQKLILEIINSMKDKKNA
ncbi:helix-turn-helix transcriptional regulator [Amphritea atlantica]|uniref:Helix-turn-helix transcriptional regulator n=1 Tax=Amphritea atlantica TaxID=355243 RepID=A0ABY5GSD4_9GAMM|nr:helix-turn-helix transcriptional regulator [Amphritea atlantica]